MALVGNGRHHCSPLTTQANPLYISNKLIPLAEGMDIRTRSLLTFTGFSIISNTYTRRTGARVPLLVNGTDKTQVLTPSIVVSTRIGGLWLPQRMKHLDIHWVVQVIDKLDRRGR